MAEKKKLSAQQQRQSIQEAVSNPPPSELVEGIKRVFGGQDPMLDLVKRKVDIKLDPSAVREAEKKAYEMLRGNKYPDSALNLPIKQPAGEYNTDMSDKEAADIMQEFDQAAELRKRLLRQKLNNQ